jgi:catechol 2,3-dioxygenase-like lactoylglutathione lyase family enzyme
MITGARFTTLYVRDQQQALDFWTEKVGFELLTDAPYDNEGVQRWIEVKAPKSDVYFVLYKADEQHEPLIGTMSHVWFACDDLDTTFKDLTSKGVSFPEEPQDAPWSPGSRWAQFADPDGNLYGLSDS